MDALSSQINVFVRLFSSINHLFCHLRWLERNIRNSSTGLMIMAGAILLFCMYSIRYMINSVHYYYNCVDSSTDNSGSGLLTMLGFPAGSDAIFKEFAPFVIVAVIIGLFIYRRQTLGTQGGSGGFNEVMFGGNGQENGRGRAGDEEEAIPLVNAQSYSVHRGVPVAPKAQFAK